MGGGVIPATAGMGAGATGSRMGMGAATRGTGAGAAADGMGVGVARMMGDFFLCLGIGATVSGCVCVVLDFFFHVNLMMPTRHHKARRCNDRILEIVRKFLTRQDNLSQPIKGIVYNIARNQ